jgi:hypothetical protein
MNLDNDPHHRPGAAPLPDRGTPRPAGVRASVLASVLASSCRNQSGIGESGILPPGTQPGHMTIG